MVTLRASVNAVGRSSMQVGISIHAENVQQPGYGRRTNRSFFSMVALDAENGPVEVPRLCCETPEDRKWQCEVVNGGCGQVTLCRIDVAGPHPSFISQ